MMLKTAIVVLASVIAIGVATSELPTMHEQIEKFSEYAGVLDRGISAKDGNQCFEKMICALESSPSTKTGSGPLDSFRRVLTNSENDFDEDNFAELLKVLKNHTYLERLADSIQYAQRSRNTGSCNAHYPACNFSVDRILEAMTDLDHFDTATGRQKRDVLSTSCDVGSIGCTVHTVGSILCTIFTFGACGWSLIGTAGCLAVEACSHLTK